MPTNGHNWCPEPTRGTRQSAILPELLWHWHRPRRKCQPLLVSIRRDLRCLNSRHLLLEGRKRCRQHLIDNRCSHLNALPPNRVPPPVPARITETRLEKLEAPGVGPRPEGLRIGKEGVGPPPEDLRSADGLIPLTV